MSLLTEPYTLREVCAEAQRWIQAVTECSFGEQGFRAALEDGQLLCKLINHIQPGLVTKVNLFPTPIAGLDNLNVFLRACGQFGLRPAQLFHPGDLQDLSSRVTIKETETSRRIKNVLITLYWLGKTARSKSEYQGPQLDLGAFEALVISAASGKKVQPLGGVRRSSFGIGKGSCSDLLTQKKTRRSYSVDLIDPFGRGKETMTQRCSTAAQPKSTTSYHQFLPSAQRTSSSDLVVQMPAPLRRKQRDGLSKNSDRRSWANASILDTSENSVFSRAQSMGDLTSTDEEGTSTTPSHKMRVEHLQQLRKVDGEDEQRWQNDLNRWKRLRKSCSRLSEIESDEEPVVNVGGRRTRTYNDMLRNREERGQEHNNGDIQRYGSPNQYDSSQHNNSDFFVSTNIDVSKSTPPGRTSDLRDSAANRVSGETSNVSDLWDETLTSNGDHRRSVVTNMTVNMKQTPVLSPNNTWDRTNAKFSRDLLAPDGSVTTPVSSPSGSPAPSPPSSPPPPLSPELSPGSRVQGDLSLDAQHVQERSSSASSLSDYSGTATSPDIYLSSSVIPSLKDQPSFEANEPTAAPRSRARETIQTFAAAPVASPRSSASKPGAVSACKSSPFSRPAANVTPKPYGAQNHKSLSLTRGAKLDSPSMAFKSSNFRWGSRESLDTLQEDFPKQAASSAEVPMVSSSSLPVSSLPEAPPRRSASKQYTDMRVYMDCQTDGRKDYGFTADWGDSGERATVDFVQPGGPAEYGQLKVGDDILVTNGQAVYSLDKVHRVDAMNDAMQSGSVVLSIRRYGTNDDDVSSPPARSTINVTSQDPGYSLSVHSTTRSLSPRSPTLSESSKLSSEPEPIQASIHTVSHSEPARAAPQREAHHDVFPMSVQNQMRRSEFFGIPGNPLENGEGTNKNDVYQERNMKLYRQKGSEEDDFGEEMNTGMDSTQDREMPYRSQVMVPSLERRRTSEGSGDVVQHRREITVSPETKARPWTRISSASTESHEYRQARDPPARQRPTGLLAQRLLQDATSRRVSDLKSTPASMEPRSAESRSHLEKERQSVTLRTSRPNTERESHGRKSLVKVENSSAVQERNKVILEMRKAVAVQRDKSWIQKNELSGKGPSYYSKRSTMPANDQSWIQRQSEMSPKERPWSVAEELSNLSLNSEDMDYEGRLLVITLT
uniref:LIM domain only protein 7 n=1 Tax=Myxine glutinosa TaxID=7769 RepID=UPI00358EE60F